MKELSCCQLFADNSTRLYVWNFAQHFQALSANQSIRVLCFHCKHNSCPWKQTAVYTAWDVNVWNVLCQQILGTSTFWSETVNKIHDDTRFWIQISYHVNIVKLVAKKTGWCSVSKGTQKWNFLHKSITSHHIPWKSYQWCSQKALGPFNFFTFFTSTKNPLIGNDLEIHTSYGLI